MKKIYDLFVGKEAKKAGLVYLEDEAHEFQVHEGGRKWSVYGSPVSLIVFCIHRALTKSSLDCHSGHR